MEYLASLGLLNFLILLVKITNGLRPSNEHHKAFLGKMKNEYDHLSIEESVRRLR